MASSFSPSNSLFPVANSQKTATESLIRFHLVPKTTGLFNIAQLREVLKVSISQIIPIPKLPFWVMGIYNWRGEILWVVDLGGLLGLTPLSEQPLTQTRLPLLVLRDENTEKTVGLIVNSVEGITRLDPNEIQSPPETTFTPELSRVLRGYWLNPEGEMLMALSTPAIFEQLPRNTDQ